MSDVSHRVSYPCDNVVDRLRGPQSSLATESRSDAPPTAPYGFELSDVSPSAPSRTTDATPTAPSESNDTVGNSPSEDESDFDSDMRVIAEEPSVVSKQPEGDRTLTSRFESKYRSGSESVPVSEDERRAPPAISVSFSDDLVESLQEEESQDDSTLRPERTMTTTTPSVDQSEVALYFSRVPVDCIDSSGTDLPSDRLVEVKGHRKLDYGSQRAVTNSIRKAAEDCGGCGESGIAEVDLSFLTTLSDTNSKIVCCLRRQPL